MSFIEEYYSFILDISISTSSSPLLLRGAPDTARIVDTVSEFHAKAPQATASEGLAQGPYMVARAGFESTTLRSTDIDSTNEPHTPHACYIISACFNIMKFQV